MRRVDWLLVMVCVACAFVAGLWAYLHGVRTGWQEAERLYSAQVRELNRIIDPTEIKAMLSEGQR